MLIPVILSGGAGTRLWPVSRQAHPKPFMRLADGETLAEKTLKRALAVSDAGETLTVTARDYYFLTRDLYESVAPEVPHHFLLEPEARNTAPAIALAALWVRDRFGPDARLLVLPADHLVDDLEEFKRVAGRADRLAGAGRLVCLGIHPTHPETGYGYIQTGEALDDGGLNARAFVEKPDLKTAQAYLDSGDYLWNAGMFCFRADVILQALNELAPDIHQAALAVWETTERGKSPMELAGEAFSMMPADSIDYAVMEKAGNRAVVPCRFNWNDIGSWKAISELYATDDAGNRIRGKAVVIDTRETFIQGEERLVAAVGVDNLVIVDTDDAVLVASRDRAQEVKAVVEQLRAQDHESAVYHRTVYRPWGSYTVLEDADDCKVKRLVVKPGEVLSLQRHQYRSEHWTVVSGRAKVRVGDDERVLEASQSTYIPAGTLHRLENPGGENVHIIETQTGSYFGEDDIERLEDVYGRV